MIKYARKAAKDRAAWAWQVLHEDGTHTQDVNMAHTHTRYLWHTHTHTI
jgi:hypothetical protein